MNELDTEGRPEDNVNDVKMSVDDAETPEIVLDVESQVTTGSDSTQNEKLDAPIKCEIQDEDIHIKVEPSETEQTARRSLDLFSDKIVHEKCQKLYGTDKCKCPDDLCPLEDFLLSTTAPIKEKIMFDSPNRVTRLCDEFQDAIYSLHFDRQLKYNGRIEQLATAWEAVHSLLPNCESRVLTTLLMWVLRYTLDNIFMVEWSTLEQDVRERIRSCIESTMSLIEDMPRIVHLCSYVLKQGDKPWSHPRLLKVMDGDLYVLKNLDLETIVDETAIMIALRLRRLCETKCDEMAFTLTSKALMALRMVGPSHPFRRNATPNTVHFIFDMFLCYVHKFINVELFLQEVKKLETVEAFRLIRRNANAEAEYPRTLKFRTKVATLTANTFAASLMLEPITPENQAIYVGIMNEWLRLHRNVPVAKFRVIARKLLSSATSSRHLYTVCRLIMRMEMPSWSDLLLEFLVRVVTSELNELELQKSEKSSSAQVLIEHEKQLSVKYLELADMLKGFHPCLTYECILTAFSLNPTAENFKLVQAVALSSRPSKENNQDEPTPPANSTLSSPTSSGRPSTSTTQSPSTASSPNQILDLIESLNLPDHIRHDLSVLLSSPRMKFLSWFQTWDMLQANCQRLLNPEAKLGIIQQSLAVANDHLQFLNLDYDQFRDLPEWDVPGIEKGYERFADSDDDDDDDSDDDDDDSDYEKHNGRAKRMATARASQKTRLKRELKANKEATKATIRMGKQAAVDLHKIGEQSEARVQQTAKNKPNLISPFNQFLMEHIAQYSRMSNTAVSREQLDEMSRQFAIQTIQAQLQMSQAYSVQLEQWTRDNSHLNLSKIRRYGGKRVKKPEFYKTSQPKSKSIANTSVPAENVKMPVDVKNTDRSQHPVTGSPSAPKLTQEQLVVSFLEKTKNIEKNKSEVPQSQNFMGKPPTGNETLKVPVTINQAQNITAPIPSSGETPMQIATSEMANNSLTVSADRQGAMSAIPAQQTQTASPLSRQSHFIAAMKAIGTIDPSKIRYVNSIVPVSTRPLIVETVTNIPEQSNLLTTQSTANTSLLMQTNSTTSTPARTFIDPQTRSSCVVDANAASLVKQVQQSHPASNNGTQNNALYSIDHNPNLDVPPEPGATVEVIAANDELAEDDDVVSVISGGHLDDLTDSETETRGMRLEAFQGNDVGGM